MSATELFNPSLNIFETKSEALGKVIALSDNVEHIFLATANNQGIPHVTLVRGLIESIDNSFLITHWFCPETVSNIMVNKNVSLVVWDAQTDEGYQCIGESEVMMESGTPEGGVFISEVSYLAPQLCNLVIKVKKILQFSMTNHSDQ